MSFPEFFAAVPTITVRDPLAAFLGAAEDGLIEYGYADAVRTAGHSCPTVAGAWLMTTSAMRRLHADEIPQRGNFDVEFAADLDSGVVGVMASIASLLTGAAGAGGFKGLAGQFSRRNLLRFGTGSAGGGELRLRRRDTGAAMDCRLDLSTVPADPRMGALLQRLLSGPGNAAEAAQFGLLWQDRVRRILLDHGDDPRVVSITPA